MPLRSLALAALASFLSAASPTTAAADATAAKAGERLRAALPEPANAAGLTLWGELWQGGQWRGSLRVAVEPSTSGEASVWSSREELRWVDGDVTRRRLVTFTLTRDLSVESVDVELEQGDTAVLAAYTRNGAALKGVAREVKGTEEGEGRQVQLAWPANATAGVGAALLMARALSAAPDGSVEVPWVSTEGWAPKQPPAARTLTLSVGGPVKGEEGSVFVDTAVFPGLGGASGVSKGRLVLARADGKLKAWGGFAGGSVDLWPTGVRPDAVTLDEHAPARTWQDAFLTFGIGYHMAQAALIERAFDWQTMYDYECGLDGGWPRERPLAEFKKAWTDEFVGKSKNRTRDETMQLLNGTLRTGKPEVRNADAVVLHAVAQFGGGVQRTYHLKRGKDGVWRLWRIDSAE
jgi:hypothetical protein